MNVLPAGVYALEFLSLSLTNTTILDWHINGKENENDTTFA